MKKIIKKAKAKVVKKTVKAAKPIGVVTHFYGKIKVGIVKFNKPIKTGTKVFFKGKSTDFTQVIGSMQLDHEVIAVAKKGKQIGLKVSKRVREGDAVFLAD